MNISGLYQFLCLSLIKYNIYYKHPHTPNSPTNTHLYSQFKIKLLLEKFLVNSGVNMKK